MNVRKVKIKISNRLNIDVEDDISTAYVQILVSKQRLMERKKKQI